MKPRPLSEQALAELHKRHRCLHDLLDLELEKGRGRRDESRDDFLDWILDELHLIGLRIENHEEVRRAA